MPRRHGFREPGDETFLTKDRSRPKLEIDVSGWPTASGTQVRLVLDPNKPRVYTFGNVGPGVPGVVHKGQHMTVAHVPPNVVPESLRKWVARNAERFEALAACRDDAGVWSEDAVDLQGELDTDLELDIDQGAVARYWEVEDWLSGCDARELISEAGGVKQAARAAVVEASDHGCVLQEDEVATYLASFTS